MTDPKEQPCLNEATQEETENNIQNTTASWHQATPSLKLILCLGSNSTCIENGPEEVFFAAIHRKHVNGYGLPDRYDRYFVVWSATAPFNMLAISQHPFLFANEADYVWSPEEIGEDTPEKLERRNQSGHFTYTAIAYAWGRYESDIWEKGKGYLDDEVILSVGVDDKAGFYGKVNVLELLQCLRICPGRL